MNYVSILTIRSTLPTIILLNFGVRAGKWESEKEKTERGAKIRSERAGGMPEVARLLIDKKFPEFESSLRSLLAGPDGSPFSWFPHLTPTKSIQHSMLPTLRTLSQNYVVLDSFDVPSRTAHNMLIPQCACQAPTAFILEYTVHNLKPTLVDDKVEALKKYVQRALDRIGANKYEPIAASFQHVKEIVKVAIGFSKWNQTVVLYETVKVNGIE